MEITTIPNDFNIDLNLSVAIYDYQSSKNSVKQLINLSKNAFSFLMEGEKEIFTSDKTLSIDNSGFFLMKSGQCLMTEKLSPNHKSYRSVLLFFDHNSLVNLIRKYGLEDVEVAEKKVAYCFQYDSYVKPFLDSLIAISIIPIEHQKRLLSLKFEEIMLYLIGIKGASFVFSLLDHSSMHSQRLISVVESNKYNRLSLKELAFLSNMSISSFQRQFKKYYSASPMKWFQDQRLDYAAFLLSKEGKRPSDVHLEIGYQDISSFIQAFKSKFGVTPKQYQQT